MIRNQGLDGQIPMNTQNNLNVNIAQFAHSFQTKPVEMKNFAFENSLDQSRHSQNSLGGVNYKKNNFSMKTPGVNSGKAMGLRVANQRINPS